MKRLTAILIAAALLLPLLWVSPACAERLGDDVLMTFYDDSIFFGDSITQQLARYRSGIRQTQPDYMSGVRMICTSSISLYAASRKHLVGEFHFKQNGVERTMYAITANLHPKKVFILLGHNDPVGINVEKAFGWVEDIIVRMEEALPGVEVYFFSLTPVTAEYCRRYNRPDYQTNVNIYNAGLREICERTGAHYVEIAAPLIDENGYLPAAYSSDNSYHLNEAGLEIWISCMLDYAQEQYDAGLWVPAQYMEVTE